MKILKFCKGCFDLTVALLLYVPVRIFVMAPLALRYRGRPTGAGRRILYLVPGGGLSLIRGKTGGDSEYREKDLDGFFDRAVVCNFAAPTREHAVLDGGKIEVIDEPRFLGTFVWITAALYTIRAFFLTLRLRPHVIRAQDAYWAGLSACIVGRLTGTPWCVSLHANYDMFHELSGFTEGPFYLGSRRLAKRGERFVLSRAPFVLAISGNIGDYAVKSGARRETVRYIPHGRNPALFDVPPDDSVRKKYIRPGCLNIVYVGRIHREKRALDIPEICAELKRRGAEFHFIALGDGRHRAEFDRAVAEKSLGGHITAPGFVPREEATRVMKAADVNFCPQGAYALIEASFSGTPVVAYDLEWNSELVQNNRTGLLVAPGDINAVCDAVLRLRDDPALGKRLADAARAFCTEHHAYTVTQQMKRDVMEEIIRKAEK